MIKKVIRKQDEYKLILESGHEMVLHPEYTGWYREELNKWLEKNSPEIDTKDYQEEERLSLLAVENEKKEIKQLLKSMSPENRKVIKYILRQLNLKEYEDA